MTNDTQKQSADDMAANPVYCALDTTDAAQAAALAKSLQGKIGGVKLGMEFFYACGANGYRQVAGLDMPVFLDLKLHDIPNTVAAAVRALCPLKPQILNVHAGGGLAMMQAAAGAATEFGAAAPLMIGVTILTSLEATDLHEMGISGTAQEQVLRLADLAQRAGLGGVVCSAHETALLRAHCGPDFKLIVPGIRPADSDTHDQKRVMTPEAARAAGADILVIGRAITGAADPSQAAADIQAGLGG